MIGNSVALHLKSGFSWLEHKYSLWCPVCIEEPVHYLLYLYKIHYFYCFKTVVLTGGS